MQVSPDNSPRVEHLGLVAWILTAVAIAASGALPRVPPVVPLIVVGTVAAWIVVYRRGGATRAWLDRVPLRAIVLGHAVRAPIGALFLWELSRGRLTESFALRAGIGDLVIGGLALGVAIAPPRRWAYAAWSLVGLGDILVAVGTAMSLLLIDRDPTLLAAFGRLPYPLLPLLIVPAVIATHLLILVRVGRAPARASTAA